MCGEKKSGKMFPEINAGRRNCPTNFAHETTGLKHAIKKSATNGKANVDNHVCYYQACSCKVEKKIEGNLGTADFEEFSDFCDLFLAVVP